MNLVGVMVKFDSCAPCQSADSYLYPMRRIYWNVKFRVLSRVNGKDCLESLLLLGLLLLLLLLLLFCISYKACFCLVPGFSLQAVK